MLDVTLAVALAAIPHPTVGLYEALRQSENVGAPAAALAAAQAAEAQHRAAWRQAYLPTLGGEAQWGTRDRDLTLSTPVGAFELGEREQWQATGRLTVPLLDLARILQLPAVRSQVEQAQAQTEQTLQQQRFAVVAAFYGWLGLQANQDANRAFIDALRERLEVTEALVRVGRAVEVDRLRVLLALDDAEQTDRALQAQLDAGRLALARLVGTNRGVQPDPERATFAPLASRSQETWVRRALAQRPDLQAAAAGLRAAEQSETAVWAEYAPRLEARGEAIYDTAALYDETFFVQGSLNLVWTPFAAGTRPARAAQARATQTQVQATLEDLQRAVRTEVVDAFRNVDVLVQEQAVARRGLTQAQAAVTAERERFAAGRATTVELLEAEALLRDRQARATRATWGYHQAVAQLRLAAGELTPPPL